MGKPETLAELIARLQKHEARAWVDMMAAETQTAKQVKNAVWCSINDFMEINGIEPSYAEHRRIIDEHSIVRG